MELITVPLRMVIVVQRYGALNTADIGARADIGAADGVATTRSSRMSATFAPLCPPPSVTSDRCAPPYFVSPTVKGAGRPFEIPAPRVRRYGRIARCFRWLPAGSRARRRAGQ